jgi:hypothetical protein
MKNVLILFLSITLFLLGLASCTPEEQENTDNQFKSLIIRTTIEEPIQASPANAITYQNSLTVSTTLGSKSIVNTVPNNIGQSVVEFVGTAVPNTNLFYNVGYGDWGMDSAGAWIYDCDEVKMEIIYDGVVVYEVTKSFGYNTCPDATGYNTNFTLQ